MAGRQIDNKRRYDVGSALRVYPGPDVWLIHAPVELDQVCRFFYTPPVKNCGSLIARKKKKIKILCYAENNCVFP